MICFVYFDYSLSSTQIEEAKKQLSFHKDDLLSISRDRALQKAFKESLSVNIAPYETVVTIEDIQEGLRSIGYPAVLRTNYLASLKRIKAILFMMKRILKKLVIY